VAVIKTVNAEGGSDARYDVSKMTPEERTQFDSEGRPLGSNNPGQWEWTDGLPGARGGNSPNSMGGGGGGGGGMSPDAYFNQLKSMLQAQKQAEEASTKGMLQKLLIGFGMVPEGFEDKLGVLDDLTKNLIAQNTGSGISQYARMLEAKGDNTKALIGRLSHTGLRRSGTKGAKLRKGQLDYDRLLSDSLQEVLNSISGAYGNMANNEQARQMQLLQALQNSQGNYWSGSGSTTQSGGGGGGGGGTQPGAQPAPTYTIGQPVGDYGMTYAGSFNQMGEDTQMFRPASGGLTMW
jgi:hypothetical protein